MMERKCFFLGRVEVVEASAKAIKVKVPDAFRAVFRYPAVWVPRRSVSYGDFMQLGEADIYISQWWLKKNGLLDALLAAIKPPVNQFASSEEA